MGVDYRYVGSSLSFLVSFNISFERCYDNLQSRHPQFKDLRQTKFSRRSMLSLYFFLKDFSSSHEATDVSHSMHLKN